MSQVASAKRKAIEQAKLILSRLLRNPKSRTGLIAAVRSEYVSRNFVYGWLTEECRTGRVTVLKTGHTLTYQLTSCIPREAPVQSPFPAWLDPRALPLSDVRRVFLDGREVNPDDPQREEDQEEAT